MMRWIPRALFLVCIGAVLQSMAAATDRKPVANSEPEVWLCAGRRIEELLGADAEWLFVKQHLDGIKLYVDQINKTPEERLTELVKLVQEQGYQVAVEIGCCLDFGPMDDSNGEWSARRELAKINKWYAAGGSVDYLDLDGPVRRLMFPHRRDSARFHLMEAAAEEVVDAVKAIHAAHPEIQFWHLTNFPNWGYKGAVSYHARGPKRQDYGDYDEAHRLVADRLKTAGVPLSGVTIDNPYDYLVGEHRSVKLKDPRSVDWLRRVRDYEERCRAEGLEVNLIINSERGGHESDARFHRETLAMLETYRKAGGRPTRWFVQSWYPHPRQMIPETEPPSMTSLVKAVIESARVGPGDEPATVDWIPAGQNADRPAWGLRGGLQWGLPPRTVRPTDGPRGLIRLRSPVLAGGKYDLINFIAVEPIVGGRRGFSELEPSQLDGLKGKRLWAREAAGRLERLDSGVETLAVRVGVERFRNGAHLELEIVQRSDAPDEIELVVDSLPDSAPIEYCILTATMGNKARARHLWLGDGVESSLELYPDYRGNRFTPHRIFSLERLRRTPSGEVLAAITTDEADPAAVDPSPAARHWRYGGVPVTQYWKKPSGSWRDDVHVAVNGRYTYWMSRHPIPGGVAFENFEMRERFRAGQRFVFGITRRTPRKLGFRLAAGRSEPDRR